MDETATPPPTPSPSDAILEMSSRMGISKAAGPGDELPSLAKGIFRHGIKPFRSKIVQAIESHDSAAISSVISDLQSLFPGVGLSDVHPDGREPSWASR